MDFGINLDFAVRRGGTHQGSFQEAFELVDLLDGRILYAGSLENPQRFGGSDVVNRISYDGGPWRGELQKAVITALNSELHENMGLACPLSVPPFGAQRPTRVGRRGGFQIPNRTPFGEPRPATPTRCPAALGEAAETDVSRSTPLGMAVRNLGRLANCLAHRQAGNRHCLAPQGVCSKYSCGTGVELQQSAQAFPKAELRSLERLPLARSGKEEKVAFALMVALPVIMLRVLGQRLA